MSLIYLKEKIQFGAILSQIQDKWEHAEVESLKSSIKFGKIRDTCSVVVDT